MEYIGPRYVEKAIGTKYNVEWDKQEHVVVIYFKGKRKENFKFDKMSQSLNFYAAIKQVKDMDRLFELYDKYR